MDSASKEAMTEQVVEICGCSKEAAAGAVEAAGEGGVELAVDFVLSMMSTVPPTSAATQALIDAPQKLVCLVRDDLQMGAGKVAAQVGHAVLGATRALARKPGGAESLSKWEGAGEVFVRDFRIREQFAALAIMI